MRGPIGRKKTTFENPSTKVLGLYIKGHFTHKTESRNHEIVRAQKKVFKGRPNTPPKSCSVVTDNQV
jgi:hypothetical protein